ncbi:hypothetical protein HD554DRAFT_2177757 [Boletus coccyginus]|nr:hypothetical protein HD554DRAFT_2177757 [Boletus coccyginus]
MTQLVGQLLEYYQERGSEISKQEFHGDIFDALQDAVTKGERLFQPHLRSFNKDIKDHNDCKDSDNNIEYKSDFRIELPVVQDTTSSHYLGWKLPIKEDSPYFPFPSKVYFIISVLFGSARIPFSNVQKKAVLDWVRKLGVADLPSLYSLKKTQDKVEKCVGYPTEEVKSINGNLFYINNIRITIGKDYANLLTHLAMQDYPDNGGPSMLQVFNGTKMMFDGPAFPAVFVGGKIYFVDELLQECSGHYFIPKCFFYGPYPAASEDFKCGVPSVDMNAGQSESVDHEVIHPGSVHPPRLKELYAFGHKVERTNASFIVSNEQVIIPTSGFNHSFEDISASPGELQCGLMELSTHLAKLDANLLHDKSQGHMIYAVPLIIFMDDISENVSKQ